MSAIAILFLVVAAVIVWGGLAASIVFLASRPETTSYPEGGSGDD